MLHDPTISRFHCEIGWVDAHVAIKDLGSLNGTTVNGVFVERGRLAGGETLRVGNTAVRFELRSDRAKLTLSDRERFGKLGAEPRWTTPGDFDRLYRDESAAWKEVIARANIRIE